MSISILIADDHAILRQGLRSLLESEPDFIILGEARNGEEAIIKTRLLNPDVVVLDLGMPDIRGTEIARQIRQYNSRIRVVILSMHSKEAYVLEALNCGAIGYVLKGSEASELVKAIRLAMTGTRFLSPPLTEDALEEYVLSTKDQTLDLLETLTNRERQIMHLAASGCSNNEIARRLTISPRTVEVHRAKVMSKLGLRNQSELIRFAIQRGIISLDGNWGPF
jgi:DNA-binding NarL/FixJ family response regulator